MRYAVPVGGLTRDARWGHAVYRFRQAVGRQGMCLHHGSAVEHAEARTAASDSAAALLLEAADAHPKIEDGPQLLYKVITEACG